jgi:hypothetical protein
MRVSLQDSYAQWVKRQWGMHEFYGVESVHDPATAFLQKHVGRPACRSIPFYEEAVLGACSKVMKSTRGMERMKAIGLWLVLCSKLQYHNWKNPSEIGRYAGITPPTARKLVNHLNMLGLVYYDHERQIIAVSRFPTGICETLHPMELHPTERPWRYFNRV